MPDPSPYADGVNKIDIKLQSFCLLRHMPSVLHKIYEVDVM